jgi:hypothetical protein
MPQLLRRFLCVLGAHKRYRVLTIGFDDVEAKCLDCGRIYRRDLF